MFRWRATVLPTAVVVLFFSERGALLSPHRRRPRPLSTRCRQPDVRQTAFHSGHFQPKHFGPDSSAKNTLVQSRGREEADGIMTKNILPTKNILLQITFHERCACAKIGLCSSQPPGQAGGWTSGETGGRRSNGRACMNTCGLRKCASSIRLGFSLQDPAETLQAHVPSH